MGAEPQLREQAAAEVDLRKRKTTEEALTQYAKNRGGVLGPADVQFMTTAIDKMNEKTDPDTVVEQAWAREYIKAMERTAERNAAQDNLKLRKEEADIYADDTARGEELGAKSEWLKTMRSAARRNT